MNEQEKREYKGCMNESNCIKRIKLIKQFKQFNFTLTITIRRKHEAKKRRNID